MSDMFFLLVGCIVALRKESVDRNHDVIKAGDALRKSLSARRAWIEILLCRHKQCAGLSLSARRAWIEIMHRRSL